MYLKPKRSHRCCFHNFAVKRRCTPCDMSVVQVWYRTVWSGISSYGVLAYPLLQCVIYSTSRSVNEWLNEWVCDRLVIQVSLSTRRLDSPLTAGPSDSRDIHTSLRVQYKRFAFEIEKRFQVNLVWLDCLPSVTELFRSPSVLSESVLPDLVISAFHIPWLSSGSVRLCTLICSTCRIAHIFLLLQCGIMSAQWRSYGHFFSRTVHWSEEALAWTARRLWIRRDLKLVVGLWIRINCIFGWCGSWIWWCLSLAERVIDNSD